MNEDNLVVNVVCCISYNSTKIKKVTTRIWAYLVGKHQTTLAKVEMWNTH